MYSSEVPTIGFAEANVRPSPERGEMWHDQIFTVERAACLKSSYLIWKRGWQGKTASKGTSWKAADNIQAADNASGVRYRPEVGRMKELQWCLEGTWARCVKQMSEKHVISNQTVRTDGLCGTLESPAKEDRDTSAPATSSQAAV